MWNSKLYKRKDNVCDVYSVLRPALAVQKGMEYVVCSAVYTRLPMCLFYTFFICYKYEKSITE